MGIDEEVLAMAERKGLIPDDVVQAHLSMRHMHVCRPATCNGAILRWKSKRLLTRRRVRTVVRHAPRIAVPM